jgi:hypothetical protein
VVYSIDHVVWRVLAQELPHAQHVASGHRLQEGLTSRRRFCCCCALRLLLHYPLELRLA